MAFLLAVGVATAVLQARAQLNDSTVEDLLDDEITEQVEDEIAESLEEAVEDEVAADVEEAVEAEIAAGVEDEIGAEIESQVSASVEEQIEGEVAASLEAEIASGVSAAIEAQVESTIEAEVSADLEGAFEGTIESSVTVTVESDLDSALPTAVRESLQNGPLAPPTGDDPGAAGDGGTNEDGSAAFFEGAVDAAGRSVESQVWVVLVPSEYADRIAGWGFSIVERIDLDALESVLLRVVAPDDRDIAEAALELAIDAPGTRVDFNHVYAPSDEALPGRPGARPSRTSRTSRTSDTGALAPGRVRVGLVDSAVAAEHPSLTGLEIRQRDFVTFANGRPTAHGTAVASILARLGARPPQGAGERRGVDEIWSAGVFFDDGGGRSMTTAANLAAALGWLAGVDGLRVVNMSLAGPPNSVLESAIDAVARRGIAVVAAVGNNGPTGEPLYPAAYDGVVGITAVDDDRRIYRYAGRGPHVTFAAPGVGVPVARAGGGDGLESGTSMAAPHVTVLLALSLAAAATTPEVALSELRHRAIDLGDKSYDEIFGFGLVGADGR